MLVEASKGSPYIKNITIGKFYYKDPEMNILHREDGPAIEYTDGDKEWWLNGYRHREDGPAIERADGDKAWYLNGKLHREDGPAVEYADGVKDWYLNNIQLTEEEFKASKEHRAYLATKQYNKTVQDRGRKGDVEGDFDF